MYLYVKKYPKDYQLVWQPIRGQGGHLGFQMNIKVTTLGWYPIRNICAKFEVDPYSRS